MATIKKIEVTDRNPVLALQGFLKKLLEQGGLGGVLVPLHLSGKGLPMPTLVTDAAQLDAADPLAPAFPVNSARLVSRLTHGQAGARLAAVLRACEIRAFVELVKLNQGSMEDVLLIGVECLGAYNNMDYRRFAGGEGGIAKTLEFLRAVRSGTGAAQGGVDLAAACKACEFPSAGIADLVVGVVGVDLDDFLPVTAQTVRGQGLLNTLDLPDVEESEAHKRALAGLTAERLAYRDRMFAETSQAVSSLEGLAEYLSCCVNCYNCRVACPVCYCKECVFVTDVFDHKPWQYLGWARQKGMLKMPTDTLFYHLTRLAHMSTACVGCGQCSNACPNDIPVMQLFRTIAAHTQKGFDYEPGRSLEEPPPLSVFKEKEFGEVTGHE